MPIIKMKHAYQFMYKVFKIVKETSGLVIIRMKTSCPVGHSVFILIITKPSVFNYHIEAKVKSFYLILRTFPLAFPIFVLDWLIGRIMWIQRENYFSVSPIHSWLFGVMVMTPVWESVGCEFKYRNVCSCKQSPSLIRLILNSK